MFTSPPGSRVSAPTLRALFGRIPAALRPRAFAPSQVTHRLCGHSMDPGEATGCGQCGPVKNLLVWPHARDAATDLGAELQAQVAFLAAERAVFERYRKANPDVVDPKFTSSAAQLVRHASAAAEAARKLEASRAAALAGADVDTKVAVFIGFLLQLPAADRRRAAALISEALEAPEVTMRALLEAAGVAFEASALPAPAEPE